MELRGCSAYVSFSLQVLRFNIQRCGQLLQGGLGVTAFVGYFTSRQWVELTHPRTLLRT